ncbi:MAG: DUF2142 domain-containing protein [Actinomycetota bacterium]
MTDDVQDGVTDHVSEPGRSGTPAAAGAAHVSDADAARRRATSVLVAALATIVLGWIVVLPPSAGSDEPGHVVRSAALVRGQLEDEGYLNVIFGGSYELPAWVGWPEPECWAFKLDVPVTCSTLLDEPTGSELRGTRAADYPVWGHLLPGVPTLLVDGPIGNRLARVFHAVIPVGLMAAALLVSARRSRMAATGVLVAITPVALFNAATVNPSGLVIAGGIALWVALAGGSAGARGGVPPDRATRWLAAAGWAAMVLPRRDGLIYAGVILAIALGIGVSSTASLRRLLTLRPALLVGASTFAALAWAATSDASSSRLLLLVPALPAAALGLRLALLRSGWSRRRLAASLAALGGLAAVVGVVFVQRRDPLLDTVKWRQIVAETAGDLFESFGVLGWLDAPMPTSFAYLFVGVVGALVGVVALARPSGLVPPTVVLLTGILLSWWLTASQVDGSPEYWQGRYYLPLLVGVPILLGSVREIDSLTDTRRFTQGIGVVVAIVSVVALGGAMRRFAVGIDGTMAPWRWHTFGAAVSPLFPMLLVAAAWIPLLWAVDRLGGERPAPARDAAAPAPDPVEVDA